ncbi:ABC-2 type transport system ATP-binding protein [Sphingobium wenxiniae]|uniref:ABC-2 type transport system ATP-binding protein n=1 Tax=Sphingobium wenxiniae (strain DSM 21828 / CGMCC 1.7748 / JZ-1) TaxID=595605 RepID=A0A562KE71_SPHWJ|nr:ATP-binding cassette domain-containing protein [Sphingobium wenxiniae]MBB6190984.1 ABC-2 type transport system ATP-binding protein [Sphingobium wenxiniae]TWH93710.1 ABC-2 type transport system ATP-binding protein [Sphingobium wenxiniae]
MIGDTLTPQTAYAVEAHGLVKTFGDFRAVNGIDIAVPTGTIYGVLGPNGAGKTTLLRTLLGIVDPDEGHRTLLGDPQPLRQSRLVGYLPEERGLYPSMKAYDAIAFMGALRGLPLKIGRERARAMLEAHGLGASADKPIRQLSKGMAQTVQLFGTIVHEPRLIVLDEPFSGLDAINQGKLEALIREQARAGVTVLFSTHVIAHAERLCERIAIVAGGRIRFEGSVAKARDRLRPQVTLRTRSSDGPWRRALPGETLAQDGAWHFALPDGGIEPLLRALLDADAGIESLSIERPGLHDAFVAIAGEAVARQMEEDRAREDTA